jgi:hypothetical protein
MKKCLSPGDFEELSETQKNALHLLWHPCRYDLAFEIVWRDVENDIYDAFIVMILDARAMNTARGCEVALKVWYPDGPPQYEFPEGMPEDDSDGTMIEENDETAMRNENIEDEASEGAKLRNQYLNKENCLPLFNIGQLIEILRQHKGEPELRFTPDEATCYVGGEEFSSEELCDALWEAVKTLL